MRNPCPHPSQLLFWVDGAMPPEEAERTAAHAAECRSCAERVAMLRSTVHGLPPPAAELQSGFAATLKRSRSPLPGPAPGPLGADMAPTTPFLPASPEGPESGESRPPTKDLRGPAQQGPRPESLQPGDTLGRFVVLGRQGSGGMGVVYAAYDPELDRKVALKILRSDAERSPLAAELRTRLLREAQAMARLSHPNVIPVYDVGTFGAQVFLAMEFVDGTTLTKHQRALPQDRGRWRAVLQLYLQAGRGLAAAHAAGLIHRDFKPDNVLVSKDGQVRVVDFGLARPEVPGGPLDGGPGAEPEAPPPRSPQLSGRAILDTPLTQSGVLIGTPAYMPPEQLAGRDVDARTDQFSFCVALWEALHGERPFKGSSAQELGQAIMSGKSPVPPAGSAAKVPSRLRRILARGLSAEPEGRYPSMEALLAELARDPSVVQRRALAAGLALVVVGASVGAGTYASRRAHRLCQGSEARLAGLWDAPRKAALKDVVLRTGLPFAPQVWASTEQEVERYAKRWVGIRQEICEATRVRGEQSEPLLDLRIRCLERRLDEVSAYLSLLDEGDAKVIEQAVQAAQAFTDPRPCQVAQLSTEQLPDDPEAKAATVKARKAMSEAKALGDAAALTRARKRAEVAVEQARQGKHRPTLAEALASLGELQDRMGEAKAARDSLQEAAWNADAVQQDPLRARALIGLSLAMYRAGRLEESLAWGNLANAALARAGGDEKLQAQVHHVLALVFQALGRSEEAVAHFTRCVDLRQRAFSADAFVIANSFQDFGRALHEQGKLDEALLQLKKAVAMERQLLGASHPQVGQARRALGAALRANGELQAALDEQRAAQEILTHSSADPVALAQLASETAQTLKGLGKSAEALGEQKAALSRLETALGPEHPVVAAALLDLAELHIDTAHPRDALPLITRSEKLSERTEGIDSPLRARASIDLGRVHLGLGRAAVALSMARSVQDRLQRSGGPPWLELRASFLAVESLWKVGQRAAAMAEAKRAEASIAPRAPADPAVGQLKEWLALRG
ncbi:MAG TPA: serine/threonine-protein kinase [Myxococcales bacterium]|nr:serine/threonine-protein kinase [Myxococcales bacterium]